MSAPLEGVLVADFSRVLAGPMATMMLADLGARVVKVERPGTGDETRAWGPPFTATATTYFESVNRGKESVALDLRDAADLAVARELAHRADVVVENFVPGTMDRLGLGYAEVSAANPGVVYCSISGFGSAQGADLLGYDFVVQAVGGLMSITGTPEEPLKVGVAVVDVLTGKDAAIGILAALAARSRTGEGARLEVSLMTSALAGLVNQGQAALATGQAPTRLANRHPSIAPYETLRCADGMVAVACGNDGQFARLATALARPDLLADPRFTTNASRVAHRDELAATLEATLTGASTDVWVERLNAAKVPAGQVASIPEAVALAERLGLEPTIDVGPATAGSPTSRQIRNPVRWAGRPPQRPTAPPLLDEHGAAVRAELAATDESPQTPRVTTPLCY